jgi:hypothetical protein
VRPAWKLCLSLVCSSLVVSACLVDPDDPCGDEFVENASGACVCPEGSVPDDDHCTACGENEHAAGGACVCDEGFARETAESSCEPAAAECEGADCPEPCEGDECGSPVCETSAECASPMLCDVHGSGSCTPPPAGLGKACASDADFQILGRSLCIPSASLSGGECPAPGKRVDRE